MCVFVYITHISHMYVHIVSPLSLLMHTWYHVGSPSPSDVRILVALQQYLDLLGSLPF